MSNLTHLITLVPEEDARDLAPVAEKAIAGEKLSDLWEGVDAEGNLINSD